MKFLLHDSDSMKDNAPTEQQTKREQQFRKLLAKVQSLSFTTRQTGKADRMTE